MLYLIMRNIKGQNLIEYVLLVVAVLLVCIYFFAINGPLSNGVGASLNSMVNQLNNLQIKF